jgi:23S rRNA pseudouridine2605 synthase
MGSSIRAAGRHPTTRSSARSSRRAILYHTLPAISTAGTHNVFTVGVAFRRSAAQPLLGRHPWEYISTPHIMGYPDACPQFVGSVGQRIPMSHRQPPKRKSPQRRFSSPRPRNDAGPVRDVDGDGASSIHGERLQKVLASAGVASRRECEELILEGRVEVDHQVVTELGTRVDPQRQEIRVDGETLRRPKLVYFAVNKPEGVVATARDPAGRPRVIDLLPPNTQRVYPVGRLDIASEGLILVTNDGDLANGLTHPRHGVEKVYQIQVAGQVEGETLGKLQRGMHLAEGFAHAKHVRIKSRRKRSTILEMVLDEGRNREVRRLLARVGHKVQKLRRIAVGPVRLGELPAGAVRSLTPKEIHSLEQAVARGGRKEPSSSSTKSPPSQFPRKKKVHKEHKGHEAKRTVIG